MAVLTTVQTGSLLDPATFGGSIPTSSDSVTVVHSGCTVPSGSSLTIINMTTGDPATARPVIVEGTLILTGTLNPLRDNGVNVSAGGVFTAATVLCNTSWSQYAVVNLGGTVSLGLLSISINAQPGRGLRNTGGTANVSQITMSINNGTAEGILVTGGTVTFTGSVSGSASGTPSTIPIMFNISGGTLNLDVDASAATFGIRRLINQSGGTVAITSLILGKNPRQEVIISSNGTLNLTDATVDVALDALFSITKISGNVNLTNCVINNIGNTAFINQNNSTWTVDGLQVNNTGDSVLLASNISNLDNIYPAGMPIGRLISGGV